jgi:glucokinase
MTDWWIGLDLGGTYIKAVALDADRTPTKTLQLETPGDRDSVIAQMIETARKLMEQEGIEADDVRGVGIGSPGPLDISGGVILGTPNIPGMTGCRIRDRISEGLSLPAILENDANAAAFGEYLCGAGGGSDMVLLTLGTGLGSGIVVDGRLLHGTHEIGAEFGHMIIVPEGEVCGCGQRGCLERYCSATYIAHLATREIRQNGRDGALRDALDRKGQIDARDINEARKAGDALAEEIWDRGTYYLALACVNICRILDPDKIVFAGGMTKAGEDLMKPLQAHFDRMHWKLTEAMTTLSLAHLGNDAGAIGAAGVAWQAFGGDDATRETTSGATDAPGKAES